MVDCLVLLYNRLHSTVFKPTQATMPLIIDNNWEEVPLNAIVSIELEIDEYCDKQRVDSIHKLFKKEKWN